jgi:hypothetical protein
MHRADMSLSVAQARKLALVEPKRSGIRSASRGFESLPPASRCKARRRFSSVKMFGNLFSRAGFVALCTAAVAMCAVTGALTASGSRSEYAWLEAVARVLTVAAPIAVGVFALHRPRFARFGRLLLIAGVVWFLTTLANADNATLNSIGRISYWVFEALLIYLLLAFPGGRIDCRLDRALVWIAVLLVLALYMPTALLVERYPVPAPLASCDVGCPPNAFMVSGSEPAVIEDLVRPLRELLTIMLFVTVAGRLAQRLRAGSSRLSWRWRAFAARPSAQPWPGVASRRSPRSSTCLCG